MTDIISSDKFTAMLQELAVHGNIASLIVGVSRGAEEQFFSAGRWDMEKEDAPNAHTQYQIGSCTKSFTAAGVAMLCGEGLLDIDDPVKKYLPELELGDAYLTDHITLRDMLSHRTGVPDYSLAWMPFLGSLDREALIAQARFYQPNLPLRYTMQYSNQMYMLLGRVIERVSGVDWADFIRQRLLVPLGMQETHTDSLSLSGDALASRPYERRGDALLRVPYSHIFAMTPAGGMASTASDLLKWIRFNMANDGKLIDKSAFEQCHIPQMLIQPGSRDYRGMPGKRQMSYGLGWYIADYQGRRIVQHGGTIDGYCAMISYAPEADCAVTVLINTGHAQVNESLPYYVFDEVFGLPYTDHTKTVLDWVAGQKSTAEKFPPCVATEPVGELSKLAGVYENELFGRFCVSAENGLLKARLGIYQTELFITGKAKYSFKLPDYDADAVFHAVFHLGSNGEAQSLSVDTDPTGKYVDYNRI